MEERSLEVNVISAQNLKKVKNFGHQACYAVAYISSSDKKASKVDKEGGVNPTWNAKLTVTCDERLLQRGKSYITVDIHSHGIFGNKLVGTSKISLLEIGKQAATGAPPKSLSFEVLRRSGKVQGVLNVSVKVGEKRYIAERSCFNNGTPVLRLSESYKRLQLQEAVPIIGSPRLYAPSSPSPISGTVTRYPPSTIGTPYPAPKVSYRASVPNADLVDLPPMSYSATSVTIPRSDASVMRYPNSGYPLVYPHQQYAQKFGSQYSGPRHAGGKQSYYASTQITSPSRYEKVHYSKPKRCGSNSSNSRGTGMGLAGGALGGLLLGDVISDIF